MAADDQDLKTLIELAKKVEVTPAEREAQRQSFAYGNTAIENDRITKELVADQARRLKS